MCKLFRCLFLLGCTSDALSDMPSIYRRTLVLRVKGYSIREIAQITNSSESNVKTRIHRARAILLKSFDT